MENNLEKYCRGIKNILMYDEEHMRYLQGCFTDIEINPNYIEYQDLNGAREIFPAGTDIHISTGNLEDSETVKLDETLMKRIAKFNKEQECKQLDEKIEAKKKKIKELDNLLKDKEKRWDKVKEYIAKIYEIDPDDCDYDYYD